jgi:hypothetical protein
MIKYVLDSLALAALVGVIYLWSLFMYAVWGLQ